MPELETIKTYETEDAATSLHLVALEDFINTIDETETDDGVIDASDAVTALNGIISALEDRDQRIAELQAQVYVPGLWRCAKCDFKLIQANLNAQDGSISARNDPGKCPNCEGSLWRVTERQAGNDTCDRLDAAHAQLVEKDAVIAELRAKVERDEKS
jgi:rubrerythrin